MLESERLELLALEQRVSICKLRMEALSDAKHYIDGNLKDAKTKLEIARSDLVFCRQLRMFK